jgi:hypothetical protein
MSLLFCVYVSFIMIPRNYCWSIVHGVSVSDLRLLGLYLNPQNGKEPMFTAAVRLLHNHGKSLDPLQVLEVLLLHQYFQIL